MKKALTLMAVFVAATAGSSAQQAEPAQQQVPQSLWLPHSAYTARPVESKVTLEPTDFFWFTSVLPRSSDGQTSDNGLSFTVPLTISGIGTIKGVGQLFSPKLVYAAYNESIFNDASNIYFDGTGSNGWTDQNYIDQFSENGDYSIDSVRLFVFNNPNNEAPDKPGSFFFYKKKVDLSTDATFKKTGFSATRASMTKVDQIDLPPDSLIKLDAGAGLISPTWIYPNGGSLSFSNQETVLMTYVQDSAKAFTPGQADTTVEFQNVNTTLEYLQGTVSAGDLSDPIDSTQTLGVFLIKNGSAADKFVSAWASNLVLNGSAGQIRMFMDANFLIFGKIDVGAGVQYHFGGTAAGQGLGGVTPNPSQGLATIPFSLTTSGHVSIDLFGTDGTQISHLVDGNYASGNFSVNLRSNELQNGVYIVRMIVGTKVYSTKMTVAH